MQPHTLAPPATHHLNKRHYGLPDHARRHTHARTVKSQLQAIEPSWVESVNKSVRRSRRATTATLAYPTQCRMERRSRWAPACICACRDLPVVVDGEALELRAGRAADQGRGVRRLLRSSLPPETHQISHMCERSNMCERRQHMCDDSPHVGTGRCLHWAGSMRRHDADGSVPPPGGKHAATRRPRQRLRPLTQSNHWCHWCRWRSCLSRRVHRRQCLALSLEASPP